MFQPISTNVRREKREFSVSSRFEEHNITLLKGVDFSNSFSVKIKLITPTALKKSKAGFGAAGPQMD